MQKASAQWNFNGDPTSGDWIGTTNNQPFPIYTNASNPSGGERMRVDANGNVGIGTSSPDYTLQVKGTIAAKQILVETSNETKDLLVLITQLQLEVEDLKQKLRCVAETEFVNSQTR